MKDHETEVAPRQRGSFFINRLLSSAIINESFMVTAKSSAVDLGKVFANWKQHYFSDQKGG